MLTVENMYGASHDIWAVNVEEEYLEAGPSGSTSSAGGTGRDAPVLPWVARSTGPESSEGAGAASPDPARSQSSLTTS
jgi:hypothetical protein